MPYDLYPAVDENYDFPQEVRVALSKSLELRNDVEPMTTVLRNNLTAVEKWDGRVIVNTDTDHIERYDAGLTSWKPIADLADVDKPSIQTSYRNKIRNGDMSVYQRGNGPFTAVGPDKLVYTIDGWAIYTEGGGATATQVVTRIDQNDGGSAWLQCVLTNQVAGFYPYIIHEIEDVHTLSGKQFTLSFEAKASVNNTKIEVYVSQWFGSGGSPSVTAISSPVTLTTTNQRFTITGNMPSIVGKTLGPVTGVEVGFTLSGDPGGNPPAQNVTIYLRDVQLEEGPNATPFERLPIQQQLAWCQRYFQRIGTNNPNIETYRDYTMFSLVQAQGGGGWFKWPLQYLQPMRAAPSITSNAPNSFLITGEPFTNAVVNSMDIYEEGALFAEIFCFVSPTTGVQNGYCASVTENNTADAYLDLTAEL